MASSTLGRERLDERISAFPQGEAAARPLSGWLRAARSALGMNRSQLARRAGVTPAAVAQAEKNEVEGVIRLATLRKFADALDCDVVYYFAPRSGSFQATVDQRIESWAETLAQRVQQTMALEDQATPDVEARKQQLKVTLERSGDIW